MYSFSNTRICRGVRRGSTTIFFVKLHPIPLLYKLDTFDPDSKLHRLCKDAVAKPGMKSVLDNDVDTTAEEFLKFGDQSAWKPRRVLLADGDEEIDVACVAILAAGDRAEYAYTGNAVLGRDPGYLAAVSLNAPGY